MRDTNCRCLVPTALDRQRGTGRVASVETSTSGPPLVATRKLGAAQGTATSDAATRVRCHGLAAVAGVWERTMSPGDATAIQPAEKQETPWNEARSQVGGSVTSGRAPAPSVA
jgi:hypothetical protein